MSASNPHLEPLVGGGTLLTWQIHLRAGNDAYTQELRFAVRLDEALVRRLIGEIGVERAVFMLWTHFRRFPSAPEVIDSERVSVEEWTRAVEALIAEIRGRESQGPSTAASEASSPRD